MMMQLRDIFDKKSPTFIITIAVLVACIVLQTESELPTPQIKLFEICVITAGIAEVIAKTALIALADWASQSDSTFHCAQHAIILLFTLVNIALCTAAWYIYIHMHESCLGSAHCFFLKIFGCLYALVFAVMIAILIERGFQDRIVTILKNDSDVENNGNDID